MKQKFPHDLELDLARQAIVRALETYVQKFAEFRPQLRWFDDHHAEVQFRAAGLTLRGTFELLPREISVEMKVPLLFRAFRKRALAVVETEIRSWIDRAKRGDLDTPGQ